MSHDVPLHALRRRGRPRAETHEEGTPPALDRRAFMHLMGASLALAQGTGCAPEAPRAILPYTRSPPGVIPGVPALYATSMTIDGYATGLLVQSREGRPIKIDGNPEHPASLGATSMHAQAAILQLYDDARARRPRRDSEATTWEALLAHLRQPRPDRGAGLRVLLEPTASPLTLALLARVRARHPEAGVVFFAPLAAENDLAGARLAFGRPLQPRHDLARAEVILSLEADLLGAGPWMIPHARQWAAGRQVPAEGGAMSRLYVVESLPSVTGSMADHRLRRRTVDIEAVARAIAAQLPGLAPPLAAALAGHAPVDPRWTGAVARDLAARPRGRTLVVVGERQPPAVHALGHAMNAALGNLGSTVRLSEPVLPVVGAGVAALGALAADMHAGRVRTLVVLGGNPAYDAPADLGFAAALARVPDTIRLGYYEDETAAACRWFGPAAHFLEAWGDGRAADGTVSLVQPLIRPLADARTPDEVLAALSGAEPRNPYRTLHDAWLARGVDEAAFQAALERGFLPDTALPATAPALDLGGLRAALARPPGAAAAAPEALTVELHASPTVHDGRFAGNAWLAEQPAPLIKLTWDNAAFVSPSTARRLRLATEDVVELALGAARVRAPVLVVPGLAADTVAVWLGYGRQAGAPLARGVGFDAYALRTRAGLHAAHGLTVTRRPGEHALARTQLEFRQHDRPIALQVTLAEYQRRPDFTEALKGPLPSLLPDFRTAGPQWAMTIDLGLCTGCSACMTACQAENNVLVVGKEQVRRGRAMHWLRIDTYLDGADEDPGFVHQPMLCQHCEKAPCEYVCPVNATVHSDDGLNEMVYNRCVGTRFCSNNCPYKVRRFNYFDWLERGPANRGLVDLRYNPEVTVRERGVMEKCTYCVQRIRGAEIAARVERRGLRPGEVVTACQAACPTGAIQFDSLTHPDTPMARGRREPRSYAVLHEHGTRPRTMYLARIANPNPELTRR